MIDVMDLKTGKAYTYDTTDPKKALCVAYQQMVKRNYNTWDYAFDEPVNESELCYFIGDLAIYKDGRRI